MLLNSNNTKPKIIRRRQNDITLSWEDIFSNVRNENYVLQIFDEFKRWKSVYWGPKTKCTVENLEPCTCFSFRLKVESSEFWTDFKAATDDGPYLVLHVTRALNLEKMSSLRKISQKSNFLLETENNQNLTPLMQMIIKGKLHMVSFLVALGVSVNLSSRLTKKTPLMWAIYCGELQISSLLISKGADVNATDINGLNILHYAIDSNNLENVKYVLGLDIEVNSADCSGWTPLLRAVILGIKSSIIYCLLANGADIAIKDKNGFDFKKHCDLVNVSYTLSNICTGKKLEE